MKKAIQSSLLAGAVVIAGALGTPTASAYDGDDFNHVFNSVGECQTFAKKNPGKQGVCLQWKDTSAYVFVEPEFGGGGDFGGF